MGLGVHGQLHRVAPEAGIVIAMYSTWPRASGDGITHGWDSTYLLTDVLLE